MPSARADARWLVQHALGLSAADLVRRSDDRPAGAAALVLSNLVERRVAREPLQLIVGDTEFRGHRLYMRRGVFIPRPETELLVEHALHATDELSVVVEPCTGTGAVACAIARERSRASVTAADVDPAAVEVARTNAAALGVDARVDVLIGDLLDPIPTTLRGAVDLLVANPPYLADQEFDRLPPEVADWDPRHALVSGTTGHEVSDLLITGATDWLRPGGLLALELDERRVGQAADRARSAGLVDARVLTDLTGRPRFILARRPH